MTRLGRSTLLLNIKAPEQMMAPDRRVMALAPQVKQASFINKLFRFFSLPAVFVKCSLYDSVYGLESPQDRLGGSAVTLASVFVALMRKTLAIQIN